MHLAVSCPFVIDPSLFIFHHNTGTRMKEYAFWNAVSALLLRIALLFSYALDSYSVNRNVRNAGQVPKRSIMTRLVDVILYITLVCPRYLQVLLIIFIHLLLSPALSVSIFIFQHSIFLLFFRPQKMACNLNI